MIMRGVDVTVERCKRRLVARGFTQRIGKDFFETFSSIVGVDTVRTDLAVSATE